MKRRIFLLMLVAVVLTVTGAFAISALPAAVALASTQPSAAAIQAAPVAPKLSTVSDWESTLENIYTQVNPSVVLINVIESPQSAAPNSQVPGFGPRQQQPQGPGFGFGQQQAPQTQAALGSGFVWDTAGHIVTNNHVIDGATSISVSFSDGTTAVGKVVGADPSMDLAVIQVNVPVSLLHPVQLGDSTQVKVGQFAVAIGNPFGEQNTMTTGIISALGRSLPSNDAAAQGGSYTIPDIIQTDAPINPGNSGGVLLNAEGQVVGVTAAIDSSANSSAGIGFAIPSAIVQKEIPSLIESGHYAHPYIGIGGTTLTAGLAQAMGLQADQRGALVGTVAPGGPAEKAGLQGSQKQATVDGEQTLVGGDVITAIDGQPVKSFDDIVSYLARSTRINQTVTLTILRNGTQQTVQVTLLARPTATSALQDSGTLG